MAIKPSDCSVFVQIYVDTNAVAQGSTKGIYLVDNRLTAGSQNEGTPTLATVATQNSNVCFSLLNVDSQDSSSLDLSNFGNSNVWGFNGTPTKYNATTWTGTLANGETSAQYSFSLNVTKQGGGGSISTQVSLSVRVIG
jgi:hypothetical protein